MNSLPVYWPVTTLASPSLKFFFIRGRGGCGVTTVNGMSSPDIKSKRNDTRDAFVKLKCLTTITSPFAQHTIAWTCTQHISAFITPGWHIAPYRVLSSLWRPLCFTPCRCATAKLFLTHHSHFCLYYNKKSTHRMHECYCNKKHEFCSDKQKMSYWPFSVVSFKF